jgi:sigma-E factor negative regulatory protein RseC
MDSPVATIISIDNGLATVSVDRTVACARCAAGKGCGAGLLGGERTPAVIELPAPEGMRLAAGDRVSLELLPANLLEASLLVYGLPLAGVVAALTAGWMIAGTLSDASAIVLAITGLLAGMAAARYRIHRNRCLQRLVPKIAMRAP